MSGLGEGHCAVLEALAERFPTFKDDVGNRREMLCEVCRHDVGADWHANRDEGSEGHAGALLWTDSPSLVLFACRDCYRRPIADIIRCWIPLGWFCGRRAWQQLHRISNDYALDAPTLKKLIAIMAKAKSLPSSKQSFWLLGEDGAKASGGRHER